MSDKRYWLWLQQTLGYAKPFDKIIEHFGSVRALYDSDYLTKKASNLFSDKIIDKMHSTSLDDMNSIINECMDNNWSILTYDDEEYPERLRNIFAPPAVIYVDGDISALDSLPALAVVGTRHASPYAIKSTTVLSKGCARCNMIIISGGALGVDTCAHEGALAVDGITYAVLGCGFGTSYLMQNEDMRRRIKLKGALVTEFAPHTSASKFTFPIRNRIISGLSNGVLVIEAGEKSGSMITASYATAQSKDVFAVTASMLDERFSGTNSLIADGAIVAVSPKRIVDFYKESYPNLDCSRLASVKELLADEYINRDISPSEDGQITFDNIEQDRKKLDERNTKAMSLKGNDALVYKALGDKFEELEAIISRSTLDAKDVLISLTMLELQGLAESTVGKRYRKKN